MTNYDISIDPNLRLERLKTTDKRVRRAIEKAIGLDIVQMPNFRKQKIRDQILYLSQEYQNKSNKIDYSSIDTQIAYSIAYYPTYIEALSDIFFQIQSLENERSCLNICDKWLRYFSTKNGANFNTSFFGSGPSPELYSLQRFIEFLFHKSELSFDHYPRISADLYEKEPAWKWSLDNITKKFLDHNQDSSRQINIQMHQQDLTQPIKHLREVYHLIVLQNIANEISDPFHPVPNLTSEHHKQVKMFDNFFLNLRYFLDRLSLGDGYLVLCDRGYINQA